MKTVVNQLDEGVVLVDVVSDAKYYGVMNSCSSKGFITRECFNGGDYYPLCSREITKGNGWSFRHPLLPNLIKILMEKHLQVFEFDTSRELFMWLTHEDQVGKIDF